MIIPLLSTNSNNGMMNRRSVGYQDQVLPEVMVLDIGDLINNFRKEWEMVLLQNNISYAHLVATNINPMVTHALMSVKDALRDKINKTVNQVLESIQQERDAELELAAMAYNDIADTEHYGVRSDGSIEQYNPIQLELANVTVRFGKSIIQRFRKESLYHRGYFPYRFVCEVGSTIAVRLIERRAQLTIEPSSVFV